MAGTSTQDSEIGTGEPVMSDDILSADAAMEEAWDESDGEDVNEHHDPEDDGRGEDSLATDVTDGSDGQLADDDTIESWTEELGGPDEEHRAASQDGTGNPSQDGGGRKDPATTASQDGGSSEGEADPWSDAPEHLRQAHLKEQEIQKKRISGLDRKLAAIRAENEELRRLSQPSDQDEGKPKEQDGQPQSARTKAFMRTVEDYPDLAEGIQAELAERDRQIEDINRRLASSNDDVVATQREDNLNQVTERFPEFGKMAQSPEFRTFIEEAPLMVRDAIKRNNEHIVDPFEARMVMELFVQSEHAGQWSGSGTAANPGADGRSLGGNSLANRRNRALDGATSVSSGAARRRTDQGTRPDPDTFDDAWDAADRDEMRARDQRTRRRA